MLLEKYIGYFLMTFEPYHGVYGSMSSINTPHARLAYYILGVRTNKFIWSIDLALPIPI